MAQLELLVAAEGYSVDQQSNALSIFTTIEEIEGRGAGLIPKLCLISVWRREQGDEERDFQAILRIQQNGQQIGQDMPLNFRFPANRHRLFHNILGLPVRPEEGAISFSILLNGQVLRSYEIIVRPLPGVG